MHRPNVNRIGLRLVSVVLAIAALSAPPVFAQTCNEQAFAEVVDATGAMLRATTSRSEPEIQRRVETLADRRGWSVTEAGLQARQIMQSPEATALDKRAADLLLQFDELSDPQPGADRCEILAKLRQVSEGLRTTSERKSQLMIASLDAALADGAGAVKLRPTSPPTAGQEATAPAVTPPPKPRAATPASKPAPAARDTVTTAPLPEPAQRSTDERRPTEERRQITSSWSTQSDPAVPDPRPQTGAPPGWATETSEQRPEVFSGLPRPALTDEELTFTDEDIRQAGRGLFGTLSAELAAVIEYVVSQYGRPNGYILGTEGGGALIAGLRYGEGKFVQRSGGISQIYWQGPSLGYDFGLTGSRVMFLVYNVRDRGDVYTRFLGVEGAAYVVGGVGLTFLKKGDIVLAPIRTGLGLRVGANVGYLKFTPRPSLNPF